VTKGVKKFGSHNRKKFDRLTTKTAELGTSYIIREVLHFET
jgi:hypothetical protein